jgi:hypothetical protein
MEARVSDVRCDGCGRFMAYAEMQPGGGATFYFEPLNEFGPEVAEWTCARCNQSEQPREAGSPNKQPASNS